MEKRKAAPRTAALRARQGAAVPAGTPAHGRKSAPDAARPPGPKETIAVTVRLDAERYRQLVSYGARFVPRRTNQEILIAALDAFFAQVE
jgi:hypothetical protein